MLAHMSASINCNTIAGAITIRCINTHNCIIINNRMSTIMCSNISVNASASVSANVRAIVIILNNITS